MNRTIATTSVDDCLAKVWESSKSAGRKSHKFRHCRDGLIQTIRQVRGPSGTRLRFLRMAKMIPRRNCAKAPVSEVSGTLQYHTHTDRQHRESKQYSFRAGQLSSLTSLDRASETDVIVIKRGSSTGSKDRRKCGILAEC